VIIIIHIIHIIMFIVIIDIIKQRYIFILDIFDSVFNIQIHIKLTGSICAKGHSTRTASSSGLFLSIYLYINNFIFLLSFL